MPEPVNGMEPNGPGPYPVLIYVHGTGAEKYPQYTAPAVLEAAAANGFVAVAPIYVGGWTLTPNGQDNQAKCIMDRQETARTALQVACERPVADCSRVVVMGHSQGGMISLRGGDYAGAKGAWAMGVFGDFVDPRYMAVAKGGTRVLTDAQVQVVTGQADFDMFPTADPYRLDDHPIIVPHKTPPDGPTDGFADHCYFELDGTRCYGGRPVDPFWQTGAASWTLPAAMDFLRAQAG